MTFFQEKGIETFISRIRVAKTLRISAVKKIAA